MLSFIILDSEQIGINSRTCVVKKIYSNFLKLDS